MEQILIGNRFDPYRKLIQSLWEIDPNLTGNGTAPFAGDGFVFVTRTSWISIRPCAARRGQMNICQIGVTDEYP